MSNHRGSARSARSQTTKASCRRGESCSRLASSRERRFRSGAPCPGLAHWRICQIPIGRLPGTGDTCDQQLDALSPGQRLAGTPNAGLQPTALSDRVLAGGILGGSDEVGPMVTGDGWVADELEKNLEPFSTIRRDGIGQRLTGFFLVEPGSSDEVGQRRRRPQHAQDSGRVRQRCLRGPALGPGSHDLPQRLHTTASPAASICSTSLGSGHSPAAIIWSTRERASGEASCTG